MMEYLLFLGAGFIGFMIGWFSGYRKFEKVGVLLATKHGQRSVFIVVSLDGASRIQQLLESADFEVELIEAYFGKIPEHLRPYLWSCGVG
jgi:hypothetical protein